MEPVDAAAAGCPDSRLLLLYANEEGNWTESEVERSMTTVSRLDCCVAGAQKLPFAGS